MSRAFSEEYVAVYDLLYGDKHYRKEADFVLARLKDVCSGSLNALLDIGCGTGTHAHCFADHGINVQGVDISEEMIALAIHRKDSCKTSSLVRFCQGDVRSFELPETFDAAVALFHVFSYLTQLADIETALRQVRKHLNVGAPFLFDYWYAGAILRDGVSHREREAENDNWHVHRVTDPFWDPEQDLVRVNFHVTAVEKKTDVTHSWHEEHPMRYFEPSFLEETLSRTGFKAVKHGEWLSEGAPQPGALGAYVVAIAV